MYVGHFASALALKGREPDAPTWGLLVGVGVLDLLFGPFVLSGIERVTATPGISPGFSLDHIDWSHSLVMTLVWSSLFALAWWRSGRRIALVMGIAVFSHFVLDFFMHPADLALWPGAGTHLGLGLWVSLPVGWWFVELGVVAACFAYYVARSRRVGGFGGRPVWVAVVLLALHALNAPWLAPSGTPDEPAAAAVGPDVALSGGERVSWGSTPAPAGCGTAEVAADSTPEMQRVDHGSRRPMMAAYTCDKCGMSIGTMTCGECDAELQHDTITKDDGTSVHVSKCPNGHGMVKSPMCCGQDMACEV